MGIPTKIINFLVGGDRPDLDPLPDRPPRGEWAGNPPGNGSNNENVEIKVPPVWHAPLVAGIRRAIKFLVSTYLPQHLVLDPDDVFFLDRLEIGALDEKAQAVLDRFMAEFSEQGRIGFLKREIGTDRQRNLRLDRFSGIHALDDSGAASVPNNTDSSAYDSVMFVDEVSQEVTFQFLFLGTWQPRIDVAPTSPPPVANGVTSLQGPLLGITLWDGEAPSGRTVNSDSYPIVIGNKARLPSGKGMGVAGTYLSTHHAEIDYSEPRVVIRDTKSRNGTWLNGARLEAGQDYPLKVGDEILFASAAPRDVAEYPRMKIMTLASTPVSPEGTPVSPEGTPVSPAFATPVPPVDVAESTRQTPALGLLTIQDVTGSRQMDITRLPFTVGRSHDQDYVVPVGNLGISREHLILEKLDDEGAWVKHPAFKKHGSRWAEDGEALPEAFHWPWDRQIILAPSFDKAPPVRIQLRKAS